MMTRLFSPHSEPLSVKNHNVKVYPSKQELKREDQLAWKIAAVASDPVAVDEEVTDMVINRVIDNASVAMASVNRGPVANARAMARQMGVDMEGVSKEEIEQAWKTLNVGPFLILTLALLFGTDLQRLAASVVS